MNYFMSANICLECGDKIKPDKKHECIIMINEFPHTGKNHMKESFNINECTVTIIKSSLPPNEENIKIMRERIN